MVPSRGGKNNVANGDGGGAVTAFVSFLQTGAHCELALPIASSLKNHLFVSART